MDAAPELFSKEELKLLIFDCDGVLVRSEPANVAYYNHLLKTFGHPEVGEGDRDKINLFHTLSTPQVVERFFPEEEREEVLAYTGKLDFCIFCDLIESEPGWEEVLSRLEKKYTLCVATNRGKSARDVLKAVGLLSFFDKVFTIKEVENPKPAPDLIELALLSYGVEKSSALYVGDSLLDYSAARGAGVPFVGFRLDSPQKVGNPHELEVLLR